jgi:hypothetical protein
VLHIAGTQLEDAISAMLDQAIMPGLASASSPDKASIPSRSFWRLLASAPVPLKQLHGGMVWNYALC